VRLDLELKFLLKSLLTTILDQLYPNAYQIVETESGGLIFKNTPLPILPITDLAMNTVDSNLNDPDVYVADLENLLNDAPTEEHAEQIKKQESDLIQSEINKQKSEIVDKYNNEKKEIKGVEDSEDKKKELLEKTRNSAKEEIKNLKEKQKKALGLIDEAYGHSKFGGDKTDSSAGEDAYISTDLDSGSDSDSSTDKK
jgi:vacuolar-type H+-ATPase subunit I/STV1